MNPNPNAPPWATFVPILVIVAIVVLRNARARNLSVGRLWIGPMLIVVLAALSIAQEPAIPSLPMIGLDVIALLVGGFLGWHRARFTRISVDPQTHALTSRSSPLGILLILGIVVIRVGLRSFATQNASALGFSVSDITTAFLLLAVGLVCMQRLEIFLRASRLLNEARGDPSAGPS